MSQLKLLTEELKRANYPLEELTEGIIKINDIQPLGIPLLSALLDDIIEGWGSYHNFNLADEEVFKAAEKISKVQSLIEEALDQKSKVA